MSKRRSSQSQKILVWTDQARLQQAIQQQLLKGHMGCQLSMRLGWRDYLAQHYSGKVLATGVYQEVWQYGWDACEQFLSTP